MGLVAQMLIQKKPASGVISGLCLLFNSLNLRRKTVLSLRCEGPHSVTRTIKLQLLQFAGPEGRAISKDPKFAECVILDKESFDPDAVFHDDIVDDEVLPKLSLAVDGLTESADGSLEMPSEDTAKNEVLKPSKVMPDATLDPEQLEVYGWESSLWRKICGYLGI